MNQSDRQEFIRFFGDVFRDRDGNPQTPFEYQCRLALEDSLPSLVNVPTGAGKTNAIVGAWLWRRLNRPESVGRRLVYCLPMRTLVDQTFNVTHAALERLNLKDAAGEDRFTVHKLMGGDVDNDWEHQPERECILIGTQDMLLSRALNRGYALSRFKWPLHFGLLNNDCLWVFDEVQLMSDGLATTAQLAAFRRKFGTFGESHSLWMSATLNREWLRQIDLAPQVDQLPLLDLSEADRAAEVLARRLNAVKQLSKADERCRLPKGLAEFVKGNHQPGSQTLVVVNTVSRAREVYDELNQAYGKSIGKGKKGAAANPTGDSGGSLPEIELIHSRFRPAERERWKTLFNEKMDPASAGRIIVATQVIEAGVDISSRLLVTDLAPFASLVQRFGRCNRGGEFEAAEIYWVDRPLTGKTAKLADKISLEGEDLEKIALPYQWQEIKDAQEQLEQLSSASPSVLAKVNYRAPYLPAHILRQRDMVDLFDTTPDLSGYDLDVSRFVRGVDERDVLIAWRQLNEQRPLPDIPRLTLRELCPVSIGEIKPFLKNKIAWSWDALERRWQKVREDRLRPGMTLLLDVKAGGYDQQRGWDAANKKEVAPEEPETKKPEEALNDDPQSNWLDYVQTLAAHSREARQAAEQILGKLSDLPLTEWRDELVFAVHHHDWGKVHPVFQETLHKGLNSTFADIVLAKSTSHARHSRPRFRHELASALALLQTGASDLVVYLAACHHGKVRLSIRALPGEVIPEAVDIRFARGIHDNDLLDAIDLGGVEKPSLTLNLEPMLLGISKDGAASWLERMLALRDRIGMFRLAYLEALIRAADVSASANPQDFWTNQEVN